jgi:NADPH:quinone reductase-like Zn-dependent oxidoreductase
MRAAIVTSYGDPVNGIELAEIAELPRTGPGEVLVEMDFAPINPADILFLRGCYATKPTLPSFIGIEGVGTVASVGPGVSHLSVGDRVAPRLSSNTWRERLLLPASAVTALNNSADLMQLSMVTVNPVTASLLLSEFKPLHRGAWILQNAANSGVGRSVIMQARDRGLHTVNLVRRPEHIRELEALGADVVIQDGPDVVERIRSALAGVDVCLALDCLSGEATGVLASAISYGAVIVSFGALTSGPMILAPSDVIYKALTLKSFYVGRPEYAQKVPDLIKASSDHVASGKLHVPIHSAFPLAEIKAAVAAAMNGGKIILDLRGVSS